MLPGIVERMRKELLNLVPANVTIAVSALDKRQYSAWYGGSIVGSLSSFEKAMCITKAEYEEQGPPFVHRKCF